MEQIFDAYWPDGKQEILQADMPLKIKQCLELLASKSDHVAHKHSQTLFEELNTANNRMILQGVCKKMGIVITSKNSVGGNSTRKTPAVLIQELKSLFDSKKNIKAAF